jgi:diacylglycerol kinase (ATP)
MESENINNNIETNPIYNKIDNLHDKIKVDLNNVLVIFVNPISGNQEGKIFLQIAKNYQTKEGYKIIDFSLIKSSDSKIKYEPFKAVFFKLIDKEEFNKGLELIRTYQESISHGEVVKTIIAGGDGTVLSIIQQLDKEGIDVNKCIFGHIPLGTGNDLSNSLGFSNHVDIKNNVDSLYKILLKYQKALLGRVDVWDMELKLDEKNGEILENTKKGKIQKKDENGNIIRLYKRTFINYLSLGYDARVGYNFDKNRTSSRLGNKCIYFWEGLKKNCCRTTINIAGFLESFTVYSDPEQSINQPSFDTFDNNDDNENIDIKFMFKSKFALTEEEKNKKCIVIRGEPCSIVCQNINLYMAGVKDIWKMGKKICL